MNRRRQRSILALIVFTGAAASLSAAEAPTSYPLSPLPRPRLTEALRAKVESERSITTEAATVKMDRVIVRETRVPSSPPKEQERKGRFSIMEGGYLLKDHGERFSTEIGLWRHIDIIEDPRDQLRQSERIRMGLLRVSW